MDKCKLRLIDVAGKMYYMIPLINPLLAAIQKMSLKLFE